MFSRFCSLRWRLQAWYTGILFLVITGLSSVLHWEITRSQWDHVDEELLSAARILEGAMRDVPQGILDSMSRDLASPPGPRPSLPPGPLFGPPPGSPQNPRDDRRGQPNRPFNRPPNPPFPSRDSVGRLDWNLGPEQANQALQKTSEWETNIIWPPAIPGQLRRGDETAYFIVWRLDGSIMKQSDVPSDVLTDLDRLLQNQIRDRLRYDRYAWQQRGPLREIYIQGPRETILCVGRSVVREHVRTGRLTASLAVTGLSILVLGALGGWWTINRAIAPIQKMSDTARGINANRLSQRMDLKGVDSEVAELGTVLNEMLDRLGDSIAQQKRFTADASHELRTPLSVILSSSELALSKPRSGEEYRDHLEKCQRAATRMRNLVESLLILARVDASPSKEHFSQVNLATVIDDSVQLLEPLATESSVTVTNETGKFFVLGDSIQLSQAFVNLISNAIKYNSPGGFVTVRSTSEGSVVLIEIIDNGMGIPESDLPHIFERFYRVDQARSRLQGGTGLGLSITERIITAHGGEIGVKSKLGEGSTFWIRLSDGALYEDNSDK